MATQPPPNNNTPADVAQTLRAMTKQPDHALRHAQDFFKNAAPDQRAQQGEQVLERMLDSSRFLQSSHPTRAFATALQVQALAKEHLPDGATRTSLRDRSFEAAGRIAHLTAGSGKPDLAARMLERADNDAGPIYRAAIMRGVQHAETPDASLRASHAQNTRDTETIRQLQEALDRSRTGNTPNSNTTGPGTIGSGAQGLDQTNETRSRLNNVGDSPTQATQRPGLTSRLKGRLVQGVKYAAVAYGAVLMAQSASVHLLGSRESSFLGTTVVTTSNYNALRMRASTSADFPGTIGMPRVGVQASQSALDDARRIGAQEGAERVQADKERSAAKPLSGAAVPDAQALVTDMNKFRLAHPDAFKEVATMARSDASASAARLREFSQGLQGDEKTLGERMQRNLDVNGTQAFQNTIYAAEQLGIQQRRQQQQKLTPGGG